MRRLIILAESPATSENKLSLFPSDLNLREPLRVPKLWFYHLFASQSTWWQISPSNWRVTFLGDLLVFTHLRCPDVCLAATRPSLQRCLALSAERLSRATRQPPDQAWRFFGELLRKPFPVWVILQPESTWQKGNVNVTLNIRKQQSTWMPNAFLPAAADSFIPRADAVVDLLDKVFPSRSHVQWWQQQCAVIPSAQKYGLLQISFSSLQLSMSRSWKAHSEYGLISGWNFSPSAFEERLTQIWNGLLHIAIAYFRRKLNSHSCRESCTHLLLKVSGQPCPAVNDCDFGGWKMLCTVATFRYLGGRTRERSNSLCFKPTQT